VSGPPEVVSDRHDGDRLGLEVHVHHADRAAHGAADARASPLACGPVRSSVLPLIPTPAPDRSVGRLPVEPVPCRALRLLPPPPAGGGGGVAGRPPPGGAAGGRGPPRCPRPRRGGRPGGGGGPAGWGRRTAAPARGRPASR